MIFIFHLFYANECWMKSHTKLYLPTKSLNHDSFHYLCLWVSCEGTFINCGLFLPWGMLKIHQVTINYHIISQHNLLHFSVECNVLSYFFWFTMFFSLCHEHTTPLITITGCMYKCMLCN